MRPQYVCVCYGKVMRMFEHDYCRMFTVNQFKHGANTSYGTTATYLRSFDYMLLTNYLTDSLAS